MPITWSGAFTDPDPEPLRRSGGGSYASTAIRTPVSVGPAKVRRRSSCQVRPFSFTFLMNDTHRAELDTFYHTTTKGGSLDFEMTDPVAGGTPDWRFTAPPSWVQVGPALYEVTIALEQLP